VLRANVGTSKGSVTLAPTATTYLTYLMIMRTSDDGGPLPVFDYRKKRKTTKKKQQQKTIHTKKTGHWKSLVIVGFQVGGGL
jgi:hypothetical protein